MSYTPQTWENGDIITAAKLNNIESGVQSVSNSYTPTTWVNGDIITAVKLNNIEQGIANAGGGSSDLTTAEVTVRFTFTALGDAMTDVSARGIAPVITNNSISSVYESSTFDLPAGATSKDVVVSMPLYKNQLITSSFEGWGIGNYTLDFGNMPTATGNATIDLNNVTAIITGDCTLNIPVRGGK